MISNKCGFLIISVLFIYACNKYSHTTATGVPIIQPKGTEHYLNSSSDFVFNPDTLHTFELTIPPKALEYINNNPSVKEYIEGSLTFNGETISPIHIRYKGSKGQFWNSLSGSDPLQPSGYKTSTKLSLRLKFNKSGITGRFYGLKNLQFHSQNSDKSQMLERLAYKLYRDMGVPTARSTHAKIIINGEYYGLYALTEQIDDIFADSNFTDNGGNLYEDVWITKTNGKTPSTEKDFLKQIKNNQHNSTRATIIADFALQFAKAKTADKQHVIKKFMDVEHIVSYIIVDRTIRTDDGAFKWYGTMNHNYFWYEASRTKKIYLIPWDLDGAFKINTSTNAKYDDIQCPQFYRREWELGGNAYCDSFTYALSLFAQEYESRISYFLSEIYTPNRIDSLLLAWSLQINQAVIDAAALHTDAVSYAEWQQGIKELKDKINYSRQLLATPRQ